MVFASAICGIAWVFGKAIGPLPSSTLLHIGFFWLGLSLLFECGFFHYLMHESWQKLLADYNILCGRLLIVVWLTRLFAPLVCGRLVTP